MIDPPGGAPVGKTSVGSVVSLGTDVSGTAVRATPQVRLSGPLFQTTLAV